APLPHSAPSGTALLPLPETPSAEPHAAPPPRSMPLPALFHSFRPSAAAPKGCCTSRLPPPSGTETTAAAARTTASVFLHAHTSSMVAVDADPPAISLSVPLPSALQTSSGSTALSPAPLAPGSPAAPPAVNARPTQKSCPESLRAPRPAHPHTPHTTPLLPLSVDAATHHCPDVGRVMLCDRPCRSASVAR